MPMIPTAAGPMRRFSLFLGVKSPALLSAPLGLVTLISAWGGTIS